MCALPDGLMCALPDGLLLLCVYCCARDAEFRNLNLANLCVCLTDSSDSEAACECEGLRAQAKNRRKLQEQDLQIWFNC